MLFKKETPKYMNQKTEDNMMEIYIYTPTHACMCKYTNVHTDVHTHSDSEHTQIKMRT